ncbi:MAG: F0F1 ATP synthase subunit epsilon [Chloroflexi bacterium]|nr:MAG: F0F1 ATP synthase subunit epsilon [Chloroflexota bacterium]TMG51260.1 MAG: F0F1 ATP synthase subunit epsilon [Chloroflexota bacterium]
MPLHLEVITPERKVYEDDVDMVVAPASEGYVGILPHHAPLFTTLGPGEFKVKRGGVEEILAVFGGFMDVRGDRVVVLTDAAEPAEEIDASRAQQARDRAQQVLAAGPASAADEQRARAELQRALVRLRVSESRRRRR